VKTNPVKVAHYLTTAMDKDEEALFVRIFPIFLIWLRTHLGASLSGGKATAHKPATVVCGLGHNRNKANRCRGPINMDQRFWALFSCIIQGDAFQLWMLDVQSAQVEDGQCWSKAKRLARLYILHGAWTDKEMKMAITRWAMEQGLTRKQDTAAMRCLWGLPARK